MSSLRVEKIESLDRLYALKAEWRRLEEAQDLLLPFFTWEWAAAWWAHFPEARRSVRDSLFARAIRDGSGALVAVAPLMLTERPGVGPVRTRFLQFFGADPNVTEVRGMLALPAVEQEAHEVLAAHLHQHADAWDWMLWGGLRSGATAEAVDRLQPVEWQRDIPDYFLPLAPSWEELKSGLSRNIKESLRKCYNSLKRDGHAFTVEIAQRPDEIGPAVEVFLRLHQARAEVTGTVTHRDVFDSSAARQFLYDVCARLAERGATRIVQLKVAGKVVASRIAFALGDSLYLYYSGYDPAWGKYSVMTTTVAEAIKYAIVSGFKQVNLSTGNDVSKTRWGPEERVYREGIQLSPSPRGRVAFEAYRYALKARDNPTVRRLAMRYLGRRAE